MDNNILLVLSAKPEGGSALFVNGIESHTGSKEMQKILELSYLAGKHKSPWCGIINDCFFIKGYFDNKDENGNEMTFSYCVTTKSLEEGKKAFFDYVKVLGYKANAASVQCLETQPKKNKTIIPGIAAIIVITLIIIILKVIK